MANTKTVGASGADYTTLEGALAWMVTNHNYGTDGIATIRIIDAGTYTLSSAAGYPYTVNLSGTPSSTAYLHITSNASDPFSGPTLDCTHTSNAALMLWDSYTYISNLKFHLNNTSTSTECIRCAIDNVSNILYSRCVFIALQQSSQQDGVYSGSISTSGAIDHCVFVGFARSAIMFQQFQNNSDTQTWTIDHCSFAVDGSDANEGGAINVRDRYASNTYNINVYNCLGYDWGGSARNIFNVYTVAGGGSTINWAGSHNVADDTSAEAKFTSSHDSVTFTESSPSAGENAWLTEINSTTETLIDLSIAGENAFTVLNGSDRTGSEPDARQDFSTDIMGNTRGATPDIGAFEFVSGGTIQAIGLASETSSAFGFGSQKNRIIGLSSETDSAFSASRAKAKALGLSAETNSALAMAHSRALNIALSSETSAAFPVEIGRRLTVATAQETDSAQSIIHSLAKSVSLASESDTAQAFTHALSRSVGLANETDAALAFLIGSGVQIGQAAESNSAAAMSVLRSVAVLLASENDTALAMAFASGTPIGLAQEADTAHPAGSGKALVIEVSSESDSGLSIPPTRLVSVTQAIETESSFVMDYSRAASLGIAAEIDASFVVTPITTLVLAPEGIDYTLEDGRLHYSPCGTLHFTLGQSRLHYIMKRGH